MKPEVGGLGQRIQHVAYNISMKKHLFIIILAALVATMLWWILRPSANISAPDANNGYTLPTSTTAQTPSDNVTVNYTKLSEGVYAVSLNYDKPDQRFSITYYTQMDSYTVALLAEPLGEVRTEAEQYLLQKTGLSEIKLCQEVGYVGTVDSVNAQYAGRNLGFSFCEGAIPLE